MTSDGMEGIDAIRLASDCDPARFVVHPLFPDSLMNVAGFVSNLRGASMMHTFAIKLAQFKHYPILFKKAYLFTAKLRLSPIVQAWLQSNCRVTLDSHPSKLVLDIRFQQVRLCGLRATLANISGIFLAALSDQTHNEPPFPPMLSWML